MSHERNRIINVSRFRRTHLRTTVQRVAYVVQIEAMTCTAPLYHIENNNYSLVESTRVHSSEEE